MCASQAIAYLVLLQDEKQALHECVRAALLETQNAAVADRAAETNGQDADVDAAVNAQIQQRRNQQVRHDSQLWADMLSQRTSTSST